MERLGVQIDSTLPTAAVISVFAAILFAGCSAQSIQNPGGIPPTATDAQSNPEEPNFEIDQSSPSACMPSFAPSMVIVPLGYQFGGEYQGTDGTTISPSEGKKYLWVQFAITNKSSRPLSSPANLYFRAIARGRLLDSYLSFPAREGYPAYESQIVEPSQLDVGWVRLTIPSDLSAGHVGVTIKGMDMSAESYCTWVTSP